MAIRGIDRPHAPALMRSSFYLEDAKLALVDVEDVATTAFTLLHTPVRAGGAAHESGRRPRVGGAVL